MLHDTYPVFFNFWRPSRYCSSSNHYVLRDSQQFRLISEGPSTLRAVALLKAVLCRDACRENTLEVVASVPAVYQFLSLEQKFKIIFVPSSFTVL